MARTKGTPRPDLPSSRARPAGERDDSLLPDPIEGKCNARTSPTTRCRNGAGQGTDHVGFGSCKHHLGSTPRGRLAGYKAQAVEYTRSLAGERRMDPVEALLWAVRLSAGAVTFWQEVINKIEQNDDAPAELLVGAAEMYGLERERLARVSATAVQAGLAERQVRIAERQGDLLAMVLEATLEHIGVSPTKVEQAKRFAAQTMLALPAGQLVGQ